MKLDFSEQEEMLKKTARDFLTIKCPKSLVRNMEEDEKGFPGDLWQEMAKLGWLGLCFPEKYGGSGASFLDLTILLEEMGRACLPGPFFPTVVLSGLSILEGGNEDQKRDLISRMAQGKLIATLALTEPSAQYDAAGINTTTKRESNEYIINGTKLFISYAHIADYIICVTRTQDGKDQKDGTSLFLVDTKSPGIKTCLLRTIANDKQYEVEFNNIRVPAVNLLGRLNRGWELVNKVSQKAAVAKCAEMLGGAQQVVEMTTNYAKMRVQFGHPIGSFQAIQHLCANMLVDVDSCRFITYQAANMLSRGLACTKEVSIAKSWVSDAYKRITATGLQIHGAIGFTKEHDMQLYYRRAKAAELLFGDANFHKEVIARELGLQP